LTNKTIDVEPEILATEIGASIEGAKPVAADIVELQRQLSSRHAHLRLKPKISSEEVAERFFRCALIHRLHQRFELHVDAIPDCVNSSHKAVRRVCVARGRHSHDGISDKAWSVAWLRLQQEHPKANVRVPGRMSPKRADLYVVARTKIVSLEFKYVGAQGLRDAAACAAQVRRHAGHHAMDFLVLYCGGPVDVLRDALARLNHHVGDVRNVRVCRHSVAGLRERLCFSTMR
jgi:hypothetical protein